jgi:hypothetical protein
VLPGEVARRSAIRYRVTGLLKGKNGRLSLQENEYYLRRYLGRDGRTHLAFDVSETEKGKCLPITGFAEKTQLTILPLPRMSWRRTGVHSSCFLDSSAQLFGHCQIGAKTGCSDWRKLCPPPSHFWYHSQDLANSWGCCYSPYTSSGRCGISINV